MYVKFSCPAGGITAALAIGGSGLSAKVGWDELYSIRFDCLFFFSSLVAGVWLTSVGGADFQITGAE